MKKWYLLILFIIICLSFNTLAAIVGDVDNNGKIGITDYVLVRKHILGISKLSTDEFNRADSNNDKKINAQDYIYIRKTIINGSSTTKIEDYINAYFLNTYNRKEYSSSYSGNDAFIFKTSNGKYVLIDTGVESEEITKTIYNELKSLQGKNTVTIDYLIISHMHHDHYGNAFDIMNNSKINIKKLILKREKYSEIDEQLVDTAKKNNIDIIEASSLKEGSNYKLSDNVRMYLFNTKDIYASNDNCGDKDYGVGFTSNVNTTSAFAKSTDNKYIYFEGSDYLKNGNKTKISTINKIEDKLGSDYRINGRFYITMINTGDKRPNCSSNANSLAVLFQVKTQKGNKYIYIPSDLENNGYNPFGEYDSTYKTTIHGYSATYFYEYKLDDGKVKFVIKDNQLVKSSKIKMVKVAASYKTALNMKDKFSDLIGNITVYQSAHHGLNNYEEVINVLKLNNKDVNIITPAGSNPKSSKMFHTSSGVYYLKNSNMMYGGGANKKGTNCSIKSDGTTSCAYY